MNYLYKLVTKTTVFVKFLIFLRKKDGKKVKRVPDDVLSSGTRFKSFYVVLSSAVDFFGVVAVYPKSFEMIEKSGFVVKDVQNHVAEIDDRPSAIV